MAEVLLKIVFSLLWLVIAGAYFRFRIGKGFRKADLSITAAFLIFSVSSVFEGEVFWQPKWNLCLKFSALALLIVSSGQMTGWLSRKTDPRGITGPSNIQREAKNKE